MSFSWYVLAIIALIAVYILQTILAGLQVNRAYVQINALKKQYQGEDLLLVSGTGKKKFFLISRGFYIILVTDWDENVVDFYQMDGYTIFANLKQKPEFIGKHLDDLEALMKHKNQKKALEDARKQLETLYEQNTADPEKVSE